MKYPLEILEGHLHGEQAILDLKTEGLQKDVYFSLTPDEQTDYHEDLRKRKDQVDQLKKAIARLKSDHGIPQLVGIIPNSPSHSIPPSAATINLLLRNKEDINTVFHLYTETWEQAGKHLALKGANVIDEYNALKIPMVRLHVDDEKYMPDLETLNSIFPMTATEGELHAQRFNVQVAQWQNKMVGFTIADLKNRSITVPPKQTFTLTLFIAK